MSSDAAQREQVKVVLAKITAKLARLSNSDLPQLITERVSITILREEPLGTTPEKLWGMLKEKVMKNQNTSTKLVTVSIILGALLAIANLAVLDCEVSLLVYENCAWLAARDALGLPQSKLLRAVLLEFIGLALL